VSGIERRDDRNVLLDSGLSDSQSEISFGYGRPFGDLWTAGASFKLRRQSLAGLSGSGMGVDVGITGRPMAVLGARAPWAQGLTWGLCLSNVVRPSIRLDRESVADPGAVRTGVAYLHPLFGYRAILAALDVEKASPTGARVHAGAEFRLHPMLALRAGVSNGSLTAGTGLRWRDLSVDYVYENHEVDPVHRLGLAYAFGPTVTESREAALRAEEEATQSRLAEAFQKRQAEQIASLLSRAEERRGEKRYDEALELLSTVAALEPGQPQAASLEALCLSDKAEQLEGTRDFAEAAILYGRAALLAPADSTAAQRQRRCQAQSDLRAARSAELRRQFQAAMDAFGVEDLAGARLGFRRVLAAEPKDEDAAMMLHRTEQAIARRTQNLLQQADRSIRANLLDEASSLVDQASALDPRADGLAQTRASLARAQQRADETNRATADSARTPARARNAAIAAAPERPPLSGQKKKEVEVFYRRGLDAMKDHRSEDAVRYWELVWSADPGYQRVGDYLKREYLMRGMDSFAAGKLDEAVSSWERALQVDPTDQRAMGYLARAQKQLARTREILGDTR
jgi:tetratricopeptide (TPR) repeat protein